VNLFPAQFCNGMLLQDGEEALSELFTFQSQTMQAWRSRSSHPQLSSPRPGDIGYASNAGQLKVGHDVGGTR
jgi:hypothetical protein